MKNNVEYQKLLDESYRKYQLDWMIRFGCSINDIIANLQSFVYGVLYDLRTDDDDDCIDYDAVAETALDNTFIKESFADWEREIGFAGNIWASKDEFKSNEFRDYDYMENLLSERDFNIWKTFFE